MLCVTLIEKALDLHCLSPSVSYWVLCIFMAQKGLTCFLKQISDYNLEAFLETLNIYIQNSGENKFINLKLKPFSVTNIKRCKISLAAFINKHTLKKFFKKVYK